MANIPDGELSPRARELLLAVGKDERGVLTVRHDLAPLQIGVGAHVLVTVESVGKEYYEWNDALEELVKNGMCEAPRDHEGEEYRVTPAGRQWVKQHP